MVWWCGGGGVVWWCDGGGVVGGCMVCGVVVVVVWYGGVWCMVLVV